MPEKVFMTENNTATFLCPKCHFSKTIDVSRYRNINKEVRIGVTCKCGHPYKAILERRRNYRKEVGLPGKYIHTSAEGLTEEGSLTVRDISRSGLKFTVGVEPKFKAGDRILAEFSLDNKQKTRVKKEVVIKMIHDDRVISSEFCSFFFSNPQDKAIAFYLFV